MVDFFFLLIRFLLHPLIVSIVLFIVLFASALQKLYLRQYEHFFTRVMAAIWFFHSSYETHYLAIAMITTTGQWFIILPFVVEILAFWTRRYNARLFKKSKMTDVNHE